MGSLIAAVWIACASFPPATARSQSAAESARLTLAEAVEQALLRNDRLIDARDSFDQARLSVRLARSAYRPKLVPNVLGSFGQTDVPNQTYRVDFLQRVPTGTEVRASVGATSLQNQAGTYYNTDTTLSVSQPLLRGFGGGDARRQLANARARAAVAARQETLAEQQVAVDVAANYYRLVAEGQRVEVARKSLERSRWLLDASSAKLSAGLVSQLDVYRARQLVSQGEAQLLEAEAAVEDARDALRGLLGRGPEYEFAVDPEIPAAVESLPAEAAVTQALDKRLELANARDAAEEAERGVRYARNQRLPQLDVNVALTRRDTVDRFSESFRFNDLRFATFFAISLPVDRTAQAVEEHNALIERDRRRRELETLRLRVVEDARRGVRSVERLVRALQVADDSVEVAEQEVEVATLRYQRGFSNNLDVVTAEGGLLAARGRRIAVLAELAVAQLRLRAVVGVLDPRRDFRPLEAS